MSINHSPSTFVGIALTVLVSLATACTFDDADDSDTPWEPSQTDDGTAEPDECLASVEQVQSTCEPPQQLFFMFDAGTSMVLVDDPLASMQVGPGAWLVEVPTASHYVGSQHYDDGHCSAGCGYCQPGQSLCHSGAFAADVSGCMLCLPWGTPDADDQCAELLDVCVGAANGSDAESGGSDEPPGEPVPDESSSGSTGSDGGLGSSGSDDDGTTSSGDGGAEHGLDETGS